MRAFVFTLIVTGACSTRATQTPVTGGDPVAGAATIREYGCNACHSIPNIHGLGGRVGPTLEHFASRAYIAGELPNTPANLVRWIRAPHDVEKHTAMPTLGLTNKEARDVAAYLYTLD
jgi:cytochrome c